MYFDSFRNFYILGGSRAFCLDPKHSLVVVRVGAVASVMCPCRVIGVMTGHLYPRFYYNTHL